MTTEQTVWRQAIELYQQPDVDWGFFEPQINVNGVDCYCVGGALAKVLTGDPTRMYCRPEDADFSPELDAVFARFAEYAAGKPTESMHPYQWVYRWNDQLPRDTGKEIVLRTLAELDDNDNKSGR